MSHLRSDITGTLARLAAVGLACCLLGGCVAVTGTSGVKEPPSAKDPDSSKSPCPAGQGSSSTDCKSPGSK
jgi:hypothetical protein